MNAIILTVGDEILIGQVVDTNSGWISETLNQIGVSVTEMLSVGDNLETITQSISNCLAKADLVIMTGGLGPTKDDITKQAIVDYFGVKMIFSETTYNRIVKIFEKMGRKLSDSLKDQCYMPENATLLRNSMGTAPGMLFTQGEKTLVALPGVPYEMKAIVTEELLPVLLKKPSAFNIYHFNIMTSGEGESNIADRISHLLEKMPEWIKLAFLPSLGYVRLRLTGKHIDDALLKKEVDHFGNLIAEELGTLVFDTKDTTLEAHIKELFVKKNLSLSTAESCTGGYLAHKLTSIPGSSSYFQGSVVTYSNDLKMKLINVSAATLDNFGAVSEETVREMVAGLLQLTATNIGIAISGIAGPDGGSAEKPVGTIWLAYGNEHKIESLKLNATKDRLKNIEYATNIAMSRLRLFVERNY